MTAASSLHSPVIGITAHPALVGVGDDRLHHQVASTPYIKAVERSGAIPVLLPIGAVRDVDTLLSIVDAVVITGGGDIEPTRYGASVDPETYAVDPERDEADLAFAERVVARNFPTLAICRGIQVLNVALGGSLHQHQPKHMRIEKYNEDAHPIDIDPGSRLHQIVGTPRLGVNTLHHQHIDALGTGVQVVAQADDGTIEAIEIESAPHVLGVQWHPELLRHRPQHLALFTALCSMR